MIFDWQNTVTLIVAVITILGTSSLIGNFLFNQFTKPIMIIDIEDKDKDSTKSKNIQIDVSNLGINPATNLSLVIDPDAEIHSISNIISTTDVSIVQPEIHSGLLLPKEEPTIIDHPFLVLKSPVFTGGDGSIIRLNLNAGKPNGDNYNLTNFNVYAVYDQGSKMGLQDASKDVLVVGLQDFFENYFSIVIILLVALAILLLIIIVKIIQKLKRSNKIRFRTRIPNANEGNPGDIYFNSGATAVGEPIGWIKLGGNPPSWNKIGDIT
jgi:hypothetical protein